MKRWILRLAVAGALLAFGAFIVAASGLIPIRASAGHWGITEWFLRFSLRRALATQSVGTTVPPDLNDPDLIQRGAAHYELACRACHGAPGEPRPRLAAHMLPAPPDLAPRVRASTPARLFQAVKHGIKFTGMPAWPAPRRDDEVWAMVAFLGAYPDLAAADYRRLAGREPEPPAPGRAVFSPLDAPATAQSCARCHGSDGLGRGNAGMPHLAGQRADYVREALQAYAAGRRHSGTMEIVAAELSAAAIDELARHFAALPPAPARGRPDGSPAAIARGEIIARNGIPADRVPACLECHAPGGRRGKPEFPLLAGQPAGYLELQLALFRENRRGGSDHEHLMRTIAGRLTPEQARDVAHYFASQRPAGQ